MYSPYFESNVPFWSDLSFRVSLGPSSWIPTFFASLKMYLQKVGRDEEGREEREGWGRWREIAHHLRCILGTVKIHAHTSG